MSDFYAHNSNPGASVHLHEMNLSERELTLLNEVGLAATQLLDVEEILGLALDTLIQKLGMSVAMIYLLDPQTGRYTLRASHGISQEQKDEIERRRISGHDITQQVVETGKAVFVPDMSVDSRFEGVWDNLDGRSYVKLALKSRGTVVGVLGLLTYEKQSLSLHSVEFLKAIGREIGIAIDNAILLTETRQREQQALTLYKLGMMISGSLSLSSVLESVAEAAQELMHADIGLVGLVDLASREVVLEAISGNCTQNIPGHKKVILDQPPWLDLAAGEPIQSSDYDQGRTILHDSKFICDEGIQSFLAVPLLRGNILLGLVEVMYQKPRQLLPNDIHLLSRLAHQVVLSIENARLYQQLHHLAALEERDRLARELHDNLSQGLGYLKIKSAITEDLMASGQIDKAQESLQELKKVSQNLYVDVREQIFNLRTIAQEQEGFFSSLQEYLADYRTHYGLRVDLMLENDCLKEFSSHVSSQLMRIIQEALTNVRRHSNASQVLIQCGQEDGLVCMCIEDNGRGFNPDQVIKEDDQHYGLKIMGERAESVGGSLEFDSKPGAGTRIIVRVPSD
jgi:signal transduction histidine kinase